MAKLPFISDESLRRYTEEVLSKAEAAEAEAEAKLHDNVIDPFSAMFSAMQQSITLDDWLAQEKARQIQKRLENALGDFHQKILGSMPGWENAGQGGSYDVKNDGKKIIAEIKNKHNTMNSSSAEAVYHKLANHLRYGEQGYKITYLVFIIPKQPEPFNRPWSPNQRTLAIREDIRVIDGKTFYSLASGHQDALHSLYAALPSVISEILGTPNAKVKTSSAFNELFYRAYSK